MATEKAGFVNAVLTSARILDAFEQGGQEKTLTELNELTGINKSRLLRICGTLVFRGYLQRDPETLKYQLGTRLMVLGRAYESANPLTALSRPVLRELAEETKETASLFIRHGDRRLCLARDDGGMRIQFVSVEGDVLDLHRGVGGKVLLAFMPDAEREGFLQRLADGSETGINESDLSKLREELRQIADRGYAVAFGDVIPDVGSIAAPVVGRDGICCASVALTGPVQRFMPERCSHLAERLLEATGQLSSRLKTDLQSSF